jgi:hypothetical protein
MACRSDINAFSENDNDNEIPLLDCLKDVHHHFFAQEKNRVFYLKFILLFYTQICKWNLSQKGKIMQVKLSFNSSLILSSSPGILNEKKSQEKNSKVLY